MNPTQKSEADFVSIDGSPPIPESEARDIVHSVFSAFIESSPKGLYASKYAPQNYKAANEKQQTKVDKPQDKGRGLNASKHAPKNTEKPETQHNKTNKAWTPKKENGLNASKHAPQNWEKAAQTQRNQASGKQRKGSGLDASKHAPQSWEKLVQTYQNKVDKAPEKESGLNAGKPPANTANESRYRDNGLGASKHAPKSSASPADTKGAKKGVVNFDDPSAFLAAMNRSFAENGGSKPTSAPSRQVKGNGPSNKPTTSPKSRERGGSDNTPKIPAGATRTVQVIGVVMERDMGWLYKQGIDGLRKPEKVVDTFIPGSPRMVYYQFPTIEQAVAFRASLKKIPEWEYCPANFVPELSI